MKNINLSEKSNTYDLEELYDPILGVEFELEKMRHIAGNDMNLLLNFVIDYRKKVNKQKNYLVFKNVRNNKPNYDIDWYNKQLEFIDATIETIKSNDIDQLIDNIVVKLQELEG